MVPPTAHRAYAIRRVLVLLLATLLAIPISIAQGGPVAAAGTPFDSLTCAPLTALPVSANTGEKPESKVWLHGGAWWAVLPTTAATPGSGTWLWKLNGATWTSVLKLSDNTDTHADVLDTGSVTHILLYRGTSSELVSVEYGSGTYAAWSARPAAAPITLDSGVETATIAVDSTGRMWLASDGTTDINVRYSDAPYSSWSSPLAIGTGVNTDDISVVTAMPGNQIGVLWSNQETERFGFRVHADADGAATWSADEVPASGSAQNVGAGMADDHLNVAVASDGTLYAAVKTSYDTAGYPKMALLVRQPGGSWDPLYGIDEAGTRPIVLLNEDASELLFVYMSTEGSGNIVYRTSSTSSISFSDKTTLISGGLAEPTSTKQSYTDDLVILATSGSNVVGRHCVQTATNTAPVATADSYGTPQDTALVVAAPGVLGNDTDAEPDPLSAALDTDVSHGTLALAPDGGFTYTPAGGYNGPDSFTYHANDGTDDSNVVTVSLTVSPAVTADYYVDNTNIGCSDSGAGSLAVPFCTMGKAATVTTAGKTARVLAGTYPETVKPNSGTVGNPVTFSAAPGVTVTGIADNSTNGGAFRITSKSYIVVDGFTITGTADYGIILDTSNHITLSNNHVSYSGTSSAHRPGIYLRVTTDFSRRRQHLRSQHIGRDPA